jgi:N-acetylneuraminic acid mutarotase
MKLVSHALSTCLLLSLGLSPGCNDDTKSTGDGAVADTTPGGDLGPGTDTGPGGDATPDGPVGDLGPDGPRPPSKWETIQDPAPQVDDHTATLLNDGKVLVVGGNKYDGTDDNYQAKTYLYDPASKKFEDGGTMNVARAEHTATLLMDSRVLVTGGKNDTDYLESTEIYDPNKPAAQAWSKGPDMAKSRWSHTATLLQSGEVLIAGGFYSSGSTASIVIYVPSSNTWKFPSAQLNTARRCHTATLLPNGKVVFTGGIQGSGSIWNTDYFDSIEIYDPGTGKMTLSKVVMSKQRCGHTATLLANGKVLIVGGVCLNKCKQDAKQVDDIYDPSTDTIVAVQHPGDLPSTHIAVRLDDKRVLVAGDTDKATAAKAVAYEPLKGGFWTTLPAMGIGRWSARAAKLKDGKVLVVGGVIDSNPYTYADKAELFHP